jgi:hypothetical protein
MNLNLQSGLKNRQQALGILAAIAVIFLVGDRLVVGPLWRLWKARATQLADLRKSVNQGSTLLERESSIRARWDHIRTNALSSEVSVAENQVFRAIDRSAQESRITINSIKPQWKRGSEDYTTFDCRIDAQGNLAALTRFLHSIERDPLALKVEAVDLTARDDAGEQLTLGLQLSGLQLPAPTSRTR